MESSHEPPQPRMREGALIAAAIVAGSLILSWGMSKSEPRYQLASAGGSVVRMDTDSGELIACNTAGCSRVQEPDRAKTFGIVGIKVESSDEKGPAIEQKPSNAN